MTTHERTSDKETGGFWERHSPKVAFLAALLLGSSGYWLLGFKDEIRSCLAKTAQLVPSVLNVSAMGAGFIGTALSILVGMKDSWLMKQLTNPLYANLYSYFLGSISWCVSLALCCIAAEFAGATDTIGPRELARVESILVSLCVLLFIGALLSCVRTFRLFSQIVKQRG